MRKTRQRAIHSKSRYRHTWGSRALTAGLLFIALPAAAQENSDPNSVEPVPIDRSYTEAMSLGLGALADGRLDSSQNSFEAASRTRPGDAAATDGLQQVQQARKLASLRNMQRRALAYESSDDWAKAQAQYRAALGVDSRLAFARKGERRSQQRGALLEQLDQLVANPERLESRDVLEQARSLASQGREVDAGSGRTRSQAQQLERLVRLAGTPIPVVLESDGRTSIQVYKVGAIGFFERKELSLVPGRYTIVGSRDGYRDVRSEIRVAIDQPMDPVRVVCTEPMP